MDFEKFDSMVDLDGLKKDVADAETNVSGSYVDVPHGVYEVAVEKLELVETKKTGKPMVTCWMKVVSDGEYKGQRIFMNQVVDQGFKIHIANEFVRSLLPTDHKLRNSIKFESYSQYSELLMDVAEAIDGAFEYGLDYGQNNKGFDTFAITDIFDVE